VEPDEIKLLPAYQRDGNERAFTDLVEPHRQWIFAAARRRLWDDHPTEDAAHAVFVVTANRPGAEVSAGAQRSSALFFPIRK
jgi:DNA-directed RNA polymerase specialized sigma24 family protein